MPREVIAEDIERFLGTVEGVASVRLLTAPSGAIDQIYVTADDATEGRAARRSIVAALMTAYGIPIEPWRIQVTRLRGARAAGLPDLKVIRVEESASATEATARVQVSWERAGERQTGTGQAKGPAGAAHRLRTLVVATIDAARAVLEPAHRRVSLQQVALTTCMDHPVVLVGISAQSSRGPEVFIGAAPQRESAAEAAVNAALDAVTKWVLHSTFGPADQIGEGDRRAHLEAMRHYARAGAGPRSEPVAGQIPLDPAPAAGQATARDAASPIHGQQEGKLLHPDVLEDLQEIRPEQKGGAAMTAHHESAPVGIAPPRAGRTVLEDGFLLPLIEARTPVHIRCRDGYEVARAVLRDVGTYTLLVEAGGATELVYKHAIISIRPLMPPPGA